MAGAVELTAGDDVNAVRSACIDIGSNPTRLLVAEPDGAGLREVLARRMFVPLVSVDGGAIEHETVTVPAPGGAAPPAALRRRRPRRGRARVRGRAHPRGRDGRNPPRRQPRDALRGDPPR